MSILQNSSEELNEIMPYTALSQLMLQSESFSLDHKRIRISRKWQKAYTCHRPTACQPCIQSVSLSECFVEHGLIALCPNNLQIFLAHREFIVINFSKSLLKFPIRNILPCE